MRCRVAIATEFERRVAEREAEGTAPQNVDSFTITSKLAYHHANDQAFFARTLDARSTARMARR